MIQVGDFLLVSQKRFDILKSYIQSKLLFTCLYHLTPEPLSLQTNEAILHRLCFPTMSLQHPQYLLAGINYHNHLHISSKLHLLIRCPCTVVSLHPNYTHFIWIFQYFQHHVFISAIHLKYFNSFLLQEGLPIKKQKIHICTQQNFGTCSYLKDQYLYYEKLKSKWVRENSYIVFKSRKNFLFLVNFVREGN